MPYRLKPKLALLNVLLFALLHSQAAIASIDAPQPFDLPKQTLAQAIIQIGKQSKISIIAPSHLLRDIKAKPLKGKYSPIEALRWLLQNTDLTLRIINRQALAVIPQKNKSKTASYSERVTEELIIIGRQITGSFLERTDVQGSAPIDIITEHELNVSGARNVAEYLKFIPAVSGNSTSTAISNGGDGTATVTLRGLPANNTLVLLNGKRISTEGLSGDAVDLNSIPLVAIERIEILKDGASAIYGTDAIAGVVNIVLKREFDGLQLNQYYATSSRNDLETNANHFLWGTSGERSSFLISAQRFEQNGLFSRERAVSANADGRPQGGIDNRSSATPNSRITLPAPITTLGILGIAPVEDDERVVTLIDNADGTSPDDFRSVLPDDLFNFRSQTSTISPSKRHSIFLRGHLDINDNLAISADGSFIETEATITFASTPLFTAFENTPTPVDATNIFNPFGQTIEDVRRRFLELPSREQLNTTAATRLSISLEGLSDELPWELNANWSETRARQSFSNLINEARVRRALGPSENCQGTEIDGCEPLNLFGPTGSITEEQLSFLRASNLRRGTTSLYSFNGNIAYDIVELSTGPISVAMGFDLRREEVVSTVERSSSTPPPNIGNSLLGDTLGNRNIYEAFVEAQIPLLRNVPGVHSLDLEVAVRHSKYSDFGKNTSPKIGFRYRPHSTLLLRSTYSEGFRAPSLGELFTSASQSQLPLNDPCSQIENVDNLIGCPTLSDDTRTQILTTFAGQPNLDPETSRSYTIGLVWTPQLNDDFSISLDQFNIEQRNIVSANAQLILNRNAEFNDFSELVSRDRDGNITRLFSPFINIGERKISGLDATVRYVKKLEKDHYISYSFNTSYLAEYAFRLDNNEPFERLAGTFEDAANEGSGALPRWKANAGVFWAYDNFEFNYSLNYISSLTETIPRTQGLTRTISSWVTHDIQARFKLGRTHAVHITLGADNILDKAPPFSAAAFNDNYDARTYDIKGAFLYGSITYTY